MHGFYLSKVKITKVKVFGNQNYDLELYKYSWFNYNIISAQQINPFTMVIIKFILCCVYCYLHL